VNKDQKSRNDVFEYERGSQLVDLQPEQPAGKIAPDVGFIHLPHRPSRSPYIEDRHQTCYRVSRHLEIEQRGGRCPTFRVVVVNSSLS
jgi:hypothetical protein